MSFCAAGRPDDFHLVTGGAARECPKSKKNIEILSESPDIIIDVWNCLYALEQESPRKRKKIADVPAAMRELIEIIINSIGANHIHFVLKTHEKYEFDGLCCEMVEQYDNVTFYIADEAASSVKRQFVSKTKPVSKRQFVSRKLTHYLHGCDDVLAMSLFVNKRKSRLVSRDNFDDRNDFINIPPFKYHLIEGVQDKKMFRKNARITEHVFDPALEFVDGPRIYDGRIEDHLSFCFASDSVSGAQKNIIHRNKKQRDCFAFFIRA
jgi:hypothetical protein